MRKATRRAVATALAAVTAVAMAAPASASTQIRVTFDPLDWDWDIPFTWQQISGDERVQTEFHAHAKEGPQWLFTYEARSAWSWGSVTDKIIIDESTLSAGGVTRYTNPLTVYAVPTVSGFVYNRDDEADQNYDNYEEYERYAPEDPDAIVLETSKARFTDESTGNTYYELKFYPTENAPRLALQNLHEKQSNGAQPEDCTHAVTLTPGQELATTDGNDIVCISVDDGDGSKDDDITIDTGDGHDTVLIEGDTQATVVVDSGAGDDVVVVDTDASVTVDGGDGRDAIVSSGDNTDATGGQGEDAILASA